MASSCMAVSLSDLSDVRQLDNLFILYTLLAELTGPDSPTYTTCCLTAYAIVMQIWQVCACVMSCCRYLSSLILMLLSVPSHRCGHRCGYMALAYPTDFLCHMSSTLSSMSLYGYLFPYINFFILIKFSFLELWWHLVPRQKRYTDIHMGMCCKKKIMIGWRNVRSMK